MINKLNKSLSASFLLLLLLVVLLSPTKVIHAQTATSTPAGAEWLTAIGIPGGQIIPVECTKSYTRTELNGAGNSIVDKCGLNQIFQIFINFTTLIVGLTGSAMMLMIVYGGTMMILAAGQAEKVSKAKEILKASIIGLIIILGAWIFINSITLTLTEGEVGNSSPAASLFGQNFNQQQSVDTQTQ